MAKRKIKKPAKRNRQLPGSMLTAREVRKNAKRKRKK